MEQSDTINFAQDEGGDFKCNQCPREYFTKIMFSLHIMEKHGLIQNDKVQIQEPNKVQINEEKTSTSKYQLILHKCPKCQWSFREKYCLQRHVASVHEKLTPYKEHIQFQMVYLVLTSLHITAIHNKLTPYNCPECLKLYGFKISLIKHISQIH